MCFPIHYCTFIKPFQTRSQQTADQAQKRYDRIESPIPRLTLHFTTLFSSTATAAVAAATTSTTCAFPIVFALPTTPSAFSIHYPFSRRIVIFVVFRFSARCPLCRLKFIIIFQLHSYWTKYGYFQILLLLLLLISNDQIEQR